jgi:hypothetical protein
MYEIVYIDTDPDTGQESDPVVLAICPDQKKATWVLHEVTEGWFKPDGPQDPTREFSMREMKIEFLKIRR